MNQFVSIYSYLIITLLSSNAFSQNILIITADDLNYNSLGFAGCDIENISPNLDSLASKSLVYENFFVSTSICHPSRQSILTGKYPHNYGSVGFKPIGPDNITLVEALQDVGYFTGMIGKIGHATPAEKFPWDYKVDKSNEGIGLGRSPSKFEKFTDAFFTSVPDDQPFLLIVNSSDPHRPFANSSEEKRLLQTSWSNREPPELNRIITPEEIQIPYWLPEEDSIKEDYANYYTSVFRLDETVGRILTSLRNSKFSENTIIIFLSDHGAPFPLAKSNVYVNSLKSNLIINWKNQILPRIDSNNFISAIDLYPTIWDLLDLPESVKDENLDGTSFKESIFDVSNEFSKKSYSLFNETAGEKVYEMRSVSTDKYHYIYNQWPTMGEEFKFRPGLTFKTIEMIMTDDSVAKSIYDKTVFRTKEELYLPADDENTMNVAKLAGYSSLIDEARKELLSMMNYYHDPLYELVKFDLENPFKINSENPLVELYPNPAIQSISIKTNLVEYSLMLFDSIGRSIEFKLDENEIDISNFKKGLYILRINTDNISFNKKFLKR